MYGTTFRLVYDCLIFQSCFILGIIGLAIEISFLNHHLPFGSSNNGMGEILSLLMETFAFFIQSPASDYCSVGVFVPKTFACFSGSRFFVRLLLILRFGGTI